MLSADQSLQSKSQESTLLAVINYCQNNLNIEVTQNDISAPTSDSVKITQGDLSLRGQFLPIIRIFLQICTNVWNSLPDTVVTAPSLLSFRHQLAKFDLSSFCVNF